MRGMHGGDIYRNSVEIDFSVNVNPLGVPEAVRIVLHKAVEMCGTYPDIKAEKLKSAVSGWLKIPKENLLFGNGASELFMAVVHATRPQKTVIPIPSFYGYEYAVQALDGDIIYYPMKEDEGYLPGENLLKILTKGVNLLFLANPNNPTARLINKEYLKRLLDICKDKKILVVLDESFIEFCGKDLSMSTEIEKYDNLLIVGAFTKIYAIPGVRLGYLIGSDQTLLHKIKKQLPEWNLSTFAQEAGIACVNQSAFIMETVDYVRCERQFLTENLRQKGLRVFPSETNFMLVHSDRLLYEDLLEQGILIRDCENFRGLSKGYYRIAVKTRRDNEMLIKAIGERK